MHPRSLWAAGLLLRRLRAERGIVALIIVLVGATSFAFAAAPRLVNSAADGALREALDAAPPAQRNISLRVDASIGAGPRDSLSIIRGAGDRLAEGIPPSVAALVTERQLVVTSARFLLPEPPAYETHLSLRYQDGLASVTRLIAGRWPVDRGIQLQEVAFGDAPDAPGARTAVFEVAFSAAQAIELGAELGDRYALTLDPSEPLTRATTFRIGPAVAEVVGLFEPLDEGDAYWSGDDALLHAEQRGRRPDEEIAYAAAYIAPEAYANLYIPEFPFHYEWRFTVDPGRIDADQVAPLRADLVKLGRLGSEARYPVVAQTGLDGILERHARERALAESVLSVAAIGPFALATAALAMVAILLARRRAATLALTRARGASGALVLGTQLWEAILLAGGAALAGLGIALAAVEARASPLSAPLALAVALTATLLLVGAAWRSARRSLVTAARDDAPIVRVAPRRLVLEGAIVAIAVGATLLLRQRGLGVASEDVPAADPLLASVPVLSGLAAGIVALRLYPAPIRALGWLAARRRDLVPVLGLRTIGRRAGAANLPLLALMLTAAFGAFASVVGSTAERSQLVASYEDVGADFRIERQGLGAFTSADLTAVPGIEAVARGQVVLRAPFSARPEQRTTITLAAIDAPAFEAVTAGTPVEPAWPQSFLAEPPADGVGTSVAPVPAILSTTVPTGTPNLQPGDTFHLGVVDRTVTFEVVERRSAFPAIDDRAPFFVVAPLEWVRAASGQPVLTTTMAWLRGPEAAAGPLAAALEAGTGNVRLTSRHAVQAALSEAPMSRLVVAGFGLAVAVAAGYMVLTIVGALILSSAQRTRDLAYLRTLGLSGRQALALTVVEHVPPVLLAVLPGIALGLGVAALTHDSLGLAVFAGNLTDAPMTVDFVALAVLAVALLAVVAAAVLAGTWLSRRARLVNALRLGDD